ncbi:MAG: hypothetical protein WEB33_09685 [Bacteroidota bacterium]
MSRNQTNLFRFLVISIISVLLTAGFVVTREPASDEKAVFTGNEQHQITTETALRYVANYHSMHGEQLTAGYMGRNIFEKILAQEGAVGIRIYNARLENGAPTYVIVGVDRNGNDLIGGIIGEDILPCPPACGVAMLRLYPDQRPIAVR